MPGRVVVQWDKDDCADMGIVKVDLLGLGMMAVLQDAFELCRERGRPLDLARTFPPDDAATYEMLQDGRHHRRVPGRESRAQMATLPRLKPKCFYDLVVEVAIIRPGPIVGQMVHPYLNAARAGGKPVTYSDPPLEPILEAHARRAAVSGAAAADGDGRRRLHRRRGRGTAPRDRLQALREADGNSEREAARRHGEATASRRTRSRRSFTSITLVRALRISRIARRPASRCSPTPAPISRCITRRRSTPRSSTTSRWGSITRPRSSRTRSGTASGFEPVCVAESEWRCTVESDETRAPGVLCRERLAAGACRRAR